MSASSQLSSRRRGVAILSSIIAFLLPAAAVAQTTAVTHAPRIQPRAEHARPAAPASVANRAVLPFDRAIRPGLEKALARERAESRPHPVKASAKPRPALLATPPPKFGGFLAAPKYLAWASSFQDDSQLVVFGTGDFNGDGKTDIVTVQNTGNINVILNQGDGTFGSPVSTSPYLTGYYVGGAVQAFGVDVDKDGKTDLVLLDWINNSVDVLPGNGDGTFGTPRLYYASTWDVASIDVADVNGDGYPDIVQVSGGQSFTSGLASTIEIDTLLNDGHGNFLTPSGAQQQVINLSGWTDTLYGRSVVLTDVNGDGIPDLTLETLAWLGTPTPAQDSTHVIQTFIGNGNGSFAQPQPISTVNIPILSTYKGSYPQLANLSVVDVNKDGVKDIVFSFEDHAIYVGLGTGSGNYQPPVNVGATGVFPTDLSVADLNGDGLPELIDAEGGYLTIYENLGGGQFDNTATPAYGSGVGLSSVLAVSDFTGDGTPDVALMNSTEDTVTLFRGVPGSVPSLYAATVLNPPSSNDNGFLPQAVLDANGDGNDDVVAFDTRPYAGNPVVLTGLGDGKGNFVYKTALTRYSPVAGDFIDQQSGDFNGDGRKDLVLHTSTGVSLLLSNGDGTFTQKTESILPFSCTTGKAAIGDLNGDGKLDLVVAYGGDVANPTCETPIVGQTATPSGVIIALGNGDGTFQTPQAIGVGDESHQAWEPVLLDANGDGKLDIALSSLPYSLINYGASATFDTYLLLGKGDGTFPTQTNLVPNNVNLHAVAGDVNNDGKADLVILTGGNVDQAGNIDSSTAGVLILLSNGDGTFTSQLSLPGFTPSAGELADFNGDGNLDLALNELASQDYTDPVAGSFILLGKGDGTFAPGSIFEAGASNSLILPGDFVKDGATDALFVSSTSGATLLVNQGGVTVTLSAVPPTIYQGQSVDVTAVVAAALTGKPQPTGTVTLLENGQNIGSADLSNGSATITLTELTQGTHTISAFYSGDKVFSPSSSATITIVVTAPPPPPSVAITAVPATLNLTRGQSGTITFTSMANSTFSGNVGFSVTGAPSGMTAQFVPAGIPLSPGQSADVTLFITTTSANTGAVKWPMRAGGAASLAALFLLAIPRRLRKRFRSLTLALLAVLTLAGAFGLSACGNGSVHLAPKGTTTLTVTANPTGLQPQTMQVTINVQ